MTRSELIKRISEKFPQLTVADVEIAVRSIFNEMSNTLTNQNRIEIRGFGSFSVHVRPPRHGRNPKTGAKVDVPAKAVPHFKPGVELRERVNNVIAEKESRIAV